MKNILLTLLCLTILPGYVWGAEVHAIVDRTSITRNDSINLKVVVSDGQGDVDISKITDFKVVSRGTSTRIQIVNGHMSKENIFNYVLLPLKMGQLRIPALDVSVGNDHLTTNPIDIKVTKSPQVDAQSRDVVIQTDAYPKTVYEGEQLRFTFRLYSAVEIANANLDAPKFKDFNAKQLKMENPYQSTLSGRSYNVSEVTYILIPLKPGDLIIEPATLAFDIVRRSRQGSGSPFGSMFDDPFFGGNRQLEHRILSSEPVKVHVKPLPDYHGSVPFSGLIGKFSMDAKIEKNKMKVGDSDTLTITVKGKGNIMDMSEPVQELPESVKVYKDNPEEKIDLTENGYAGQKIYRNAIVPVEPGNITLKPIQLVYFDVETQKYELLKTDKIDIEVTGSAKANQLTVFNNQENKIVPGVLKKSVKFTGRDILPVKEEIDAIDPQKTLSIPFFMLFIVLPGIGYLILVCITYFVRKDLDTTALMTKRAHEAIKHAESLKLSDENKDQFLSDLYRAVVSSVLALGGIRGQSLTHEEIKQIVSSKKDESVVLNTIEHLTKIESTKYSPSGLDTDYYKTLLQETRKLIRSLVK